MTNEEWNKEESNLYKHALHELQVAGLEGSNDEYDQWIADCVLQIVARFAQQGHSGGSAEMVQALLREALAFKPLTPITNSPDDWFCHTEGVGDEPLWQCRRAPSLFSNDGGQTYYDVNETMEDNEVTMITAKNLEGTNA